MAKFNRSTERDAGRGRGERKPGPGSEKKDDKPGYKAKRSFTKNKEFRSNKPAEKRRSGDNARRPYKKEGGGESGNYRERKRDFDKSGNFRERKPFKRDSDREGDVRDKSGNDRTEGNDREKRAYNEKRGGGDRRRDDRDSRVPFEKKFSREERPGRDFERPRRNEGEGRPFKKRKFEGFKTASAGADTERPKEDTGKPKRRFSKPRKHEGDDERRVKYEDFEEGQVFSNKRNGREEIKKAPKKGPVKKQTGEGLIRLNKYLSNAGIASRREADNLIQSGVVKVNGVVVDQLGYKINAGDKVTYGDSNVKSERKVYLLLNKPKDYITTVDDPRDRKTVMELIKGACRERVYPVGRLDRNTTGLLLFTNDGELTTKLTHPKFGVKKVYHVSLNKGLKPADFTAIVEGVELEDGLVKADDLAFVGEGKKEIGIEIHSGRNRIVRRLFEHLGYDVLKLDRVVFAGLTKKDLPRGKHRFLSAKEIGFLQMIG
jgi:23S rRNA pseudouridine2605 synthase